MKMQLELRKINCPKCGFDVSDKFLKFLSELTGMKKIDLKNGGLQVVRTAFFVGKEIMQIKGVEVANENIARKIVEEALEKLEKIQKPRIEKEKLKEIEAQIEKRYQLIVEENRHLKKELRTLQRQYIENHKQILEGIGQLTYQPLLIGTSQEKQIATRLASISRTDRFNLEKSTKQGEDVLAIVIESKKEIGRIVIESKKVKRWSNSFIKQIRRYMQRENAKFGIIATTTLPSDALNPKIYKITDDGIWIVKLEYLEVAYRALRDLLIKIYEIEKLSKKKITDFENIVREFRNIITDKKYQQKFVQIKEGIDAIREVASRIESQAITNSKKLQEVADALLTNLTIIESENQKILEKFKVT